jgi:ADP-heptose:LPS heptosyltransferase
MGDILLSTPAVRAVAEFYGTSEVDYIVGNGNREALTGIPYIHQIIEWNPRGEDAKPKPFLRFLQTLRRSRYDLFINFQPSAKTLLMATASGASKVLTFRKDVSPHGNTGTVRHAIDDFVKELKPLGIDGVTNRRMDFHVPDEAQESLQTKLQEYGVSEGQRLVAVNPGGTRQINRWATAKFSALLNQIAEVAPDIRLIITGGPDDVERAKEVVTGVHPTVPVINLAHKLTIKEMGALLTRVAVFVTPDTGPLHIGSAVGANMVVLSGAADPDRTGPQNPGDLVVINRNLSCVPCRDRSCSRRDIACMEEMAVGWVYEAVRQRLAVQGKILPQREWVTMPIIERVENRGRFRLPMQEEKS